MFAQRIQKRKLQYRHGQEPEGKRRMQAGQQEQQDKGSGKAAPEQDHGFHRSLVMVIPEAVDGSRIRAKQGAFKWV